MKQEMHGNRLHFQSFKCIFAIQETHRHGIDPTTPHMHCGIELDLNATELSLMKKNCSALVLACAFSSALLLTTKMST